MPTAIEKVAETYAARRPLAPPTHGFRANTLPAAPADPAAAATAADPALQTQTQRMAGRYGTSSQTIPQSGPAFAEYRRKAEAAGLDEASARKALDAFLSLGDEPPQQ